MPWTLSHPAAILPLRRLTPRWLDFAALVFGSMTSDMGYYINRFDLAYQAHTLPGSFMVGLPTGVVMLLVFYLVCKPVCYALPAPHRQALLPLCPAFPTSVRRWAIILLSLLLGAWTHNFWDAFTHEQGWFVVRIPWLQQPVLEITSTTVYMFLVFQELSTVVGFAIIAIVYWRWRRQQNRVTRAENDRWRYFFWAATVGLALVISFFFAAHYATSLHGFLFFRSVVFRTAIYSPRVAVPLILVGAALLYARRSRAT